MFWDGRSNCQTPTRGIVTAWSNSRYPSGKHYQYGYPSAEHWKRAIAHAQTPHSGINTGKMADDKNKNCLVILMRGMIVSISSGHHHYECVHVRLKRKKMALEPLMLWTVRHVQQVTSFYLRPVLFSGIVVTPVRLCLIIIKVPIDLNHFGVDWSEIFLKEKTWGSVRVNVAL